MIQAMKGRHILAWGSALGLRAWVHTLDLIRQ